MRVVAYLRVSTDKQVDEGHGMDVQREAIRKWASGNANRIVGEFRDEGISGSNGLETRAGLGDAVEYLKRGKAEGLVVYRLDRLARDLVLQETLLAEIRKMGANLFSTSNVENGYPSDDDSDPSRALVRQVLGAVSQYERAMVRMRLLAGQRRKAEKGGYAGFGSPPLGQRAEGKELVADPTEQITLLRILELHGEKKSLRVIAKVLTEEGRKPKRSQTWHPHTIAKIIQRESPDQTPDERRVPKISTECWPYWGCATCGKVGRLVEVVDCHPPFLPGMVVEVDASGAGLPVEPLPDDSGDTVEQGLGIGFAMKRATGG